MDFFKRIFGITPKKETAENKDIKKEEIKKEVEVKNQKNISKKEETK